MRESNSAVTCDICGEPMPEGEPFRYHGYSGPCPKPPLRSAAGGGEPQQDVLALRARVIVVMRGVCEQPTNQEVYDLLRDYEAAVRADAIHREER